MEITSMILPLVIVFFVLVSIIFWVNRYKKCPSNKILVVYGKTGKQRAAKCIHGGGTFVVPLIQDYAYLDLIPLNIEINLAKALSKQNIRINVPSRFTIGITTNPDYMNNAAERLLGLNRESIENLASEIILGQMRLAVASMSIEDINGNRDHFLKTIEDNVVSELQKIGLELINVNVVDIQDDDNYIKSIGQQAAAIVVEKARVDVAIEHKKGAIGSETAKNEQEIKVSELQAQTIIGQQKAQSNQKIEVAKLNAEAVKGENLSEAEVAQSESELAVKKANAYQISEVAKLKADQLIALENQKTDAEILRASNIVPAQIEKEKQLIEAQRNYDVKIKEADAAAYELFAEKEAEAKGIKAIYQAKADGYKELVASVGNNPQVALNMLWLEQLRDVAAINAETIQNLKIDKIIVWDNGNGTTKNFLSSFIESIPPMDSLFKAAGKQLPNWMVEDQTNNQKIDKN